MLLDFTFVSQWYHMGVELHSIIELNQPLAPYPIWDHAAWGINSYRLPENGLHGPVHTFSWAQRFAIKC